MAILPLPLPTAALSPRLREDLRGDLESFGSAPFEKTIRVQLRPVAPRSNPAPARHARSQARPTSPSDTKQYFLELMRIFLGPFIALPSMAGSAMAHFAIYKAMARALPEHKAWAAILATTPITTMLVVLSWFLGKWCSKRLLRLCIVAGKVANGQAVRVEAVKAAGFFGLGVRASRLLLAISFVSQWIAACFLISHLAVWGTFPANYEHSAILLVAMCSWSAVLAVASVCAIFVCGQRLAKEEIALEA